MTPRDPPGGCHDHKPWAVAGTDPGDSAPRSSTTGCTRPRQGSNKIDATAERRTRQASGNCRQSCGQTRVTDAQEEAALGAEGAPSRRQGGPRRASPHLLHDSPPPVRHQQPEPSSVGGLSDPCPRQAQTLSQGPAILWGPPRLRSLSDSASRWKVVHTVSPSVSPSHRPHRLPSSHPSFLSLKTSPFLQRRQTDGQNTQEKTLSITNH